MDDEPRSSLDGCPLQQRLNRSNKTQPRIQEQQSENHADLPIEKTTRGARESARPCAAIRTGGSGSSEKGFDEEAGWKNAEGAKTADSSRKLQR